MKVYFRDNCMVPYIEEWHMKSDDRYEPAEIEYVDSTFRLVDTTRGRSAVNFWVEDIYCDHDRVYRLDLDEFEKVFMSCNIEDGIFQAKFGLKKRGCSLSLEVLEARK